MTRSILSRRSGFIDLNPGEKLLWDIKVTAGARFNASHRLASKDRFANLSLAFYSAILLSISIITVAYSLDPLMTKALSVGGIVASVMTLILSMKMFADRHAVDSEQMHRCALEINEICRRYQTQELARSAILKRATAEYNAVLQKYSINHTEKDYLKYKYSHRWEFEDLTDSRSSGELFEIVARELGQNLFERVSALTGAAGLAAAVSALLASMIG